MLRVVTPRCHKAWGVASVVSGPLSVAEKPKTGAWRIEVGGRRSEDRGQTTEIRL